MEDEEDKVMNKKSLRNNDSLEEQEKRVILRPHNPPDNINENIMNKNSIQNDSQDGLKDKKYKKK